MNSNQEERIDWEEDNRLEPFIIRLKLGNPNLTPEAILRIKNQTGKMMFSSENDDSIELISEEELFSYEPNAISEQTITGEEIVIISSDEMMDGSDRKYFDSNE